jgi:hypothetical protein
MRPRHWVKNVLVAAPLFGPALDVDSLLRVGWAFVAFSMTASAFYLINDVRDTEGDRNHPVKKHRPIAAGLVPIPLKTLPSTQGPTGSDSLPGQPMHSLEVEGTSDQGPLAFELLQSPE